MEILWIISGWIIESLLFTLQLDQGDLSTSISSPIYPIYSFEFHFAKLNRGHLFIQPHDCGNSGFSEWLLISNGEFPNLHSLRNPIPGELKIPIKLSPRKCQKSRLKKPNMNYNDISWWETSQFHTISIWIPSLHQLQLQLAFFFSEGHRRSSRRGGWLRSQLHLRNLGSKNDGQRWSVMEYDI